LETSKGFVVLHHALIAAHMAVMVGVDFFTAENSFYMDDRAPAGSAARQGPGFRPAAFGSSNLESRLAMESARPRLFSVVRVCNAPGNIPFEICFDRHGFVAYCSGKLLQKVFKQLNSHCILAPKNLPSTDSVPL
jgi:hypothetical protein